MVVVGSRQLDLFFQLCQGGCFGFIFFGQFFLSQQVQCLVWVFGGKGFLYCRFFVYGFNCFGRGGFRQGSQYVKVVVCKDGVIVDVNWQGVEIYILYVERLEDFVDSFFVCLYIEGMAYMAYEVDFMWIDFIVFVQYLFVNMYFYYFVYNKVFGIV